MKIRRNNQQMCGFCGVQLATQMGHVVPRAIFHRQPEIHWTIPACDKCERGSGDGIERPISQDEEYFRDVFCLDAGVENHPVVPDLFEKFRGSTGNSGRFRTAVAGTFEWRLPANDSGIVLPHAVPTIGIETNRFERVLRKIAKGLYYKFNNQKPVPTNYEIEVESRITNEGFYWLLEQFKNLRNTGLHSLGEDRVFEFLGARAAEPNGSDQSYLMVFYGRYVALAAVYIAQQASGAAALPETG